MVLGDLRSIVGAATMAGRQIHEFLSDYALANLAPLARAIHGRSKPICGSKSPRCRTAYTSSASISTAIRSRRTCTRRSTSMAGRHVDYRARRRKHARRRSIAPITRPCLHDVSLQVRAGRRIFPNNEGLFRPIRVTAPEGSLLNCTFPAPVKARAKATNNINQVLFGALWPVLRSIRRKPAAARSGPFTSLGTIQTMAGSPSTACRMAGAAHCGYGWRLPVAFPHNSAVTPVEIMELRAPILSRRKRCVPILRAPGAPAEVLAKRSWYAASRPRR